MKATLLESTTLATVAYDAVRELLQVEFTDHAVYQYFGVPVEVHDALLRAPSKGKFFNSAIRGRFTYALASDMHS